MHLFDTSSGPCLNHANLKNYLAIIQVAQCQFWVSKEELLPWALHPGLAGTTLISTNPTITKREKHGQLNMINLQDYAVDFTLDSSIAVPLPQKKTRSACWRSKQVGRSPPVLPKKGGKRRSCQRAIHVLQDELVQTSDGPRPFFEERNILDMVLHIMSRVLVGVWYPHLRSHHKSSPEHVARCSRQKHAAHNMVLHMDGNMEASTVKTQLSGEVKAESSVRSDALVPSSFLLLVWKTGRC